MPSTLFGSQTPAAGNASDVTAYTMGTKFTPNVAGSATHGRWYFPSTIPHASTQVQVGIYRDGDSALLGATSFPLAATLGAWNQVAFSSPIALAAGTAYTAFIWTPDRYVATNSYAWPTGAGDVVSAGSAAGRFTAAGTPSFPTNNAGGAYFADLVFVADSEGASVTVGGLAVPITLGALSVGSTNSVTVGGLAVPITLGALSVSSSGGVTPPAPTVVQPGSWWMLDSIAEENAAYAREERSAPTACPNDGEPLQRNPRTGKMQCSFDGYVWRG